MTTLARHPKVIKLAHDLGLTTRGDCLRAIREFAVTAVGRVVDDAPLAVDSLELFRRLVLDKYRVRLEFIREDADVRCIADKYASFHPDLAQRLRQEFVEGSTEGITLERDAWDARLFRYLAVIDARVGRAARAYFTAWHEITHLVLHPAQLPFPGFRRTPVATAIAKDPLESVVDHVAGHLGFFPRFFAPMLRHATRQHGCSFSAFDLVRANIEPMPSLFATAMASLHHVDLPLVLIEIDLAYKKAEERGRRSGQGTFSFLNQPAPHARAVKVVANALARDAGIVVRQNMRVPTTSVLMRAFESAGEIDCMAVEGQALWASTAGGPLPALALMVQAARRGRYVYGLLTVA